MTARGSSVFLLKLSCIATNYANTGEKKGKYLWLKISRENRENTVTMLIHLLDGKQIET